LEIQKKSIRVHSAIDMMRKAAALGFCMLWGFMLWWEVQSVMSNWH